MLKIYRQIGIIPPQAIEFKKGAENRDHLACMFIDAIREVASWAAGISDNKKPAHDGLSVWGQILLSVQSRLRTVNIS
ncbi:hypothetical protein THH46_11710 [Pseudomonas sp. NA13]